MSRGDPEKPSNFFAEDYWRNKIQESRLEALAERSLRLTLYLKATNEIVGMANFTSFERGPFQNCRLGYKDGKAFEGQDLMREALAAVIEQRIFDTLRFHRVEANFMPVNVRSERLLKRLGFQFHGRAERYLRINGQWQDHILASRVNAKWTSGLPR